MGVGGRGCEWGRNSRKGEQDRKAVRGRVEGVGQGWKWIDRGETGAGQEWQGRCTADDDAAVWKKKLKQKKLNIPPPRRDRLQSFANVLQVSS